MNKVIVRINGQEYSMVGKESKDYLLRVANYVDEKMEEITKANPKLSTAMAAVLTSLNIADELFKAAKELDEANSKFNKPIQELEDANSVASVLRDSLENKQQEIEVLKSVMERYVDEIGALQESNKNLEEKIKEKDNKIAQVQEVADTFENRLFDMQMKIVELEKNKMLKD